MAKRDHPQPKIANFNTSPRDGQIITTIARKAVGISLKLGIAYDEKVVERDLVVCHLNITPLDLEGLLLQAGEDELVADVIGVHLNIDRRFLTLQNGFCPRWKTR